MIMLGEDGDDLRFIIFRSACETRPEHNGIDVSVYDGMNISISEYDVRTFSEEQMIYAMMNFEEPGPYFGRKPKYVRFFGAAPDITAEVIF